MKNVNDVNCRMLVNNSCNTYRVIMTPSLKEGVLYYSSTAPPTYYDPPNLLTAQVECKKFFFPLIFIDLNLCPSYTDFQIGTYFLRIVSLNYGFQLKINLTVS